MEKLEFKDLHASIQGKEILKGVSLTIKRGELHSIMGPNGSGKSTLSLIAMGHPAYEVTSGDVLLDGESILELSPDERARKGLFLSFQAPVEVPGLSLSKFLFTASGALREKPPSLIDFSKNLKQSLSDVGLFDEFSKRQLNVGFSGGEKKRNEVLQMKVLKPRFAILDEIDSGLDIDALKTVASAINAEKTQAGLLVITHYQRLLKHLQPDFVHVMVNGRIVKSGGQELAVLLEEKGYASLLKDLGVSNGS